MFFARLCPSPIRALALLAVVFFTSSLFAQESEPIEVKTMAGLRFDPPRIVVKPGAKVRIHVENADDMAHNFVITAPGAREEIVNAALTMPVTPEQTFIPETDKILHHTEVLIPGKTADLEFTAPAEGIYPYVCTYPGHGLIMYGALYVTNQSEKDLPAIAEDVNIPEIIRDQAKNTGLHAFPAEPPYWYRMFIRESGPASIAVALPGGQNYCWDAGACRLRSVWRGAFLDPMPHWKANGDAFAEIKGTVYYRPRAFPLRFGDAKKVPTDIKFLGYDIVGGLPEFRYQIGAVGVRERIQAMHHGGVEATFKLTGAKSATFFVVDQDAGVEVASDAGKFTNGVLKVPAAKTKEFLVTYVEAPNREPIGYWSMNDTLSVSKPLPVDGIKNRAVTFDGKKAQFATGIKTDAFAQGLTFSIWAKLTNPEVPDQAYIGAHTEKGEIALGANLSGNKGFGVNIQSGQNQARILAAMPLEADANWHHLAATSDGKKLRFYFDGKPAGVASAVNLPAGAELYLGSSGKTHYAGATLDEARIYGRTLNDQDISALYLSELPATAAKKAK